MYLQCVEIFKVRLSHEEIWHDAVDRAHVSMVWLQLGSIEWLWMQQVVDDIDAGCQIWKGAEYPALALSAPAVRLLAALKPAFDERPS